MSLLAAWRKFVLWNLTSCPVLVFNTALTHASQAPKSQSSDTFNSDQQSLTHFWGPGAYWLCMMLYCLAWQSS